LFCAYIIAAGTGFAVNYIELKILVSDVLEFYLKSNGLKHMRVWGKQVFGAHKM